MRYIYFDLGAYNGDTIKYFLRKRNLIQPPSEFEIHAFEPNPAFKDILRDTLTVMHKDWSLDARAIWTDNKDRQFAVDNTETPMGSTLMAGKTAIWDTMPHIKVPCLDFSDYLKSFKGNYIIVKMDIEGAEFPVLEKMLADGTINYVTQLWCEFHPNKVREYTTKDKRALVKRLRKHTEVVLWH